MTGTAVVVPLLLECYLAVNLHSVWPFNACPSAEQRMTVVSCSGYALPTKSTILRLSR